MREDGEKIGFLAQTENLQRENARILMNHTIFVLNFLSFRSFGSFELHCTIFVVARKRAVHRLTFQSSP